MKRAIIVGGGIAGLLSAHRLAPFFDEILILERDTHLDDPGGRRFVPQSHHVHTLMKGCEALLLQWFPELSEIMDAAGAPELELSRDFLYYGLKGGVPRYSSGVRVRMVSRIFLENQLRSRVLQDRRIRILTEAEAVGLKLDPEGISVTGIRFVRKEQGAEPGERTESSDLVVDASGRGTHFYRWLSEAGYPVPAVKIAKSDEGYASRYFRLKQASSGWKFLRIYRVPPSRNRGGTIVPVENGLHLVSLVSRKDDLPSDDSQFLEFAKGLACPFLHEAIRDAEPVGPVHHYRNFDNTCRMMTQTARWPRGLVSLGDSVATFTPLSGQGISVAAFSARALGELAPEFGKEPGWEERFHQEVIRICETSWALATKGGRLVEPGSSLRRRFEGWIYSKVQKWAQSDPETHWAQLQVQQLMKPIESLYSLRTLRRILLLELRDRFKLSRVTGDVK